MLMWDSSGLTTNSLFLAFPEPVLVVYGARLNRLIDGPYRQWWRVIAPIFLHVNLIHLLINMYSLWMIGPYVEKLYGSAKFVFFWIVTGTVSFIASYLAVQPGSHANIVGRFLLKSVDVPSVGASGALFGLVGVLFVFGIKFRRELPEGFKRAFGFGMLPVIVINLFIGYIGRGMFDNAAHIGGLLSGAALALVVNYRRPGARTSISTVWRVLQVACILVTLVAFYKVVRYSAPTAEFAAVDEVYPLKDPKQLILLNYLAVMTRGQETAAIVIHDRNLNDVATVTQALVQAPVPDAKAGELRDRLVAVLTKLYNDVASKNGTNPPGEVDPKLIEERNSLLNDYDKWLHQVHPATELNTGE